MPCIQRQHGLEIVTVHPRGLFQLRFHGGQFSKHISPRLGRDSLLLGRLSQGLDVLHQASPNSFPDGDQVRMRPHIREARARQCFIHPRRLSHVDLDLVHE